MADYRMHNYSAGDQDYYSLGGNNIFGPSTPSVSIQDFELLIKYAEFLFKAVGIEISFSKFKYMKLEDKEAFLKSIQRENKIKDILE